MSGKPFLVVVALILLVTYSILLPRPDHHSARETAILAEIDQLHIAVQVHKEKHLVYPPCMAEPNLDVRKQQFMWHLRTVYPNSAYGSRASDFDNLSTYISANYQVPGAGGPVALDLNRLDPAESLVFWLGGFPTPAGSGGQPIASSRLFGFHRDSDSPMKHLPAPPGTDPLADRTTARFDFRQDRLVDHDGDGWWEYVPTPPSVGSPAPFVYFDHDLYARDGNLGVVAFPTDPQLAARWGTVAPMAAYLDPSGKAPTRWQNPQSFQILCGGLDGKYSAPSAPPRITIFPTGDTYSGPNFNGKPTPYDHEELDNLTNLQRQNFGDARSEAGGDSRDETSLGLGAILAPIVALMVASLIAYLFIRMQSESRPIGGRIKPAGDPPDFSHVVERRSEGEPAGREP